MKTALTVVTFALLLTACKEPAATKVVPTASVAGKILYRSACQSGASVPFTPPASGAGDVGPYLYLSDMNGKIVSTSVTTRLDGTFVIPKVPVGAYQLRIRAQELRNFWVGAPVATIGVIVNDAAVKTSATVQVGTACVDNDKPRADAVLASWGDAVTMTASRGKTIHLEAASVQTRLDLLGSDPDGDPLRAQFANNSGDIAAAASSSASAYWPHATGVTSDTLRVLVTDGYGGNIALQLPVRLHQSRILPLRSGGWSEFSDAATAASFDRLYELPDDMATSPTWISSPTGLVAKVEGTSTQPIFMALRSPDQFEMTSTVITEARFTVLQSSMDWTAMSMLTDHGGYWLVGFLLHKDASGSELRLVGAELNTLSSVRLEGLPGEQFSLRLEVDPALGIATGSFQSETHDKVTIQFAIGQVPAVQVASLTVVGAMTLENEALEIEVSGVYTAMVTQLYGIPSRPGAIGDQVYNQHPLSDELGTIVSINEDAAFGSETIMMSIPPSQPLSFGLLRFFGDRPVSALTDMSVEDAAVSGHIIDSWDSDAAYTLDRNQGLLY